MTAAGEREPVSSTRRHFPTLVIVGTETLVRFAMMGEQLARCSGNALLLPTEGVTHDGPYRKPGEFMDAIEALMQLTDLRKEGAAKVPGHGGHCRGAAVMRRCRAPTDPPESVRCDGGR